MHLKFMGMCSIATLLSAGTLASAAELNWSVFADQTALSSPTSEARSLRALAINP